MALERYRRRLVVALSCRHGLSWKHGTRKSPIRPVPCCANISAQPLFCHTGCFFFHMGIDQLALYRNAVY